ncbi:MAG TPA: SAF domain-containing protein [Baekduia sp.]|nr:SAF domain-containing protein [Baekduia sp.]
MTRARRAVLLIGLALVLGALSAADMGGRERALQAALKPLVDVTVAREEIKAGSRIQASMLTTRRVPSRYAPAVGVDAPAALIGGLAAVVIPAGSDVTLAQIRDDDAGPALRSGERIVDVVAAGSARLVVAGAHVDVLVTRERGGTALALQDAEVVSARGLPAEDGSPARLIAGLRVTVRQAVYLTAAQSFAREIRLLPRAVGDRSRQDQGLAVGTELEE